MFDMTLTPAELKAIEDHKYFLSIERGAEATIDEAIADFADRHATRWRRDKARRDAIAQIEAIDALRRVRSAEIGREVSRGEFAIEWCTRHAAAWRAEREALENNDLLRLEFTAPHSPAALALSGPAVASTVAPFDCDVYVHGRGLPHVSFVLGGRPFAPAKSVRSVPALEVVADQPLEFIATGSHARRALNALREFLEQLPFTVATPVHLDDSRPAPATPAS